MFFHFVQLLNFQTQSPASWHGEDPPLRQVSQVLRRQVTVGRAHPGIPRRHHDKMRRMRQGVHQHQHDVQAQEGGAPEREAAQVHRVYDVV